MVKLLNLNQNTTIYFFDAGERIFSKNLDSPKPYTEIALKQNDRRDERRIRFKKKS